MSVLFFIYLVGIPCFAVSAGFILDLDWTVREVSRALLLGVTWPLAVVCVIVWSVGEEIDRRGAA